MSKKSIKELLIQQLDQNENQTVIAATEFSSSTDKIIIPADMSKLEASKELKRQYEDEENIVDIDQAYTDWHWQDVLVALKVVSTDTFGWIQGMTTRSFFGTSRPTFIKVMTDVKDGKAIYEECFYGKFKISAWDDAECTVNVSRFGVASVSIQLKKRFKAKGADFLSKVDNHIRKNSIYLNKAVVIEQGDKFEGAPEFEIIELKPSNKIFLNPKTRLVVNKYIINLLPQEGKRTVLFSGAYGNGKTETAMQIGLEALNKGLNFFYVKNTSDFATVYNTVKKYSSQTISVLFAEDIDEATSGTERTSTINDLLNILDGVQGKGSNIKTILTTNHENKINPAARRPGRIDNVIPFGNPEPDVAIQIMQSWIEDFPTENVNVDWNLVKNEMPQDASGALYAEIGKRMYVDAMEAGSVDTESVLAACASLEYQAEFMRQEVEESNTLEKAIKVVGSALGTSFEREDE